MPLIHVSQSRRIPVAPGRVYAVLVDYTAGHAQILPRRYFSNLEVVRGGVGDGTIISFQMHAFGSVQKLRAEITEPIPGELLVETIVATGAKTTFHVLPESGGQESLVTITTDWTTQGLTGWLQSLLIPRFLRKVYEEELANLAAVAAAGH